MAEIQSLDFVIDQDGGTQLYEAYLDITASNLYVRQVDTSLAIVGSAEDFDAATEAEIAARTYKLAVYVCNDPTQASNADRVIAFGRMQKT
ncbi:MAG: hypothetical protein GY743_23385 [Planctomycetaceae bacterium]|nr:hypothetical protein [Planctomycetaceae bacterium]